jgi:hypothetical protein
VLSGAAVDFEPAVLKKVLYGRWRLAMAVALKPTPETPLEFTDAENLLAECDVMLGDLKLADDAPDALKSAYDPSRKALARDAVDLSNFIQKAYEHAAKVAALSSAPKKLPKQPRIIAVQTESAKQYALEKRKKLMMWSAFVAVMLAGAAFHGYNYLQTANQGGGPQEYAGAPKNAVVIQPKSGILMMTPKAGGIDPKEKEKFKADLQAKGYKAVEMGGQLMAFPPGMAPAGMPDKIGP